jgi:membrane protein implicated in regulation of membrane protease activity
VGIVFLAALVLGLGILGLQFVLPGGGGDGADHVDHIDSADHADGDAHGHGGHHENPSGFLPIFLSLRFWTFGLMAFGSVGSLIHFLGFAGPLVSAPLAIAMGVGSGFLAAWTLRKLSQSDANSASDTSDAVGQVARVLLPCGKAQRGKIRIELKGQTYDLSATTDDEQLENGAYVLIEEMRSGTAHVSRAPDSVIPRRD